MNKFCGNSCDPAQQSYKLVAKFGLISSSLLNRQLLSAPNTGHCTRKCYSLSRAGSGGGGPGVLCEGALVCGGGPGQQN